MKLHDRHAGQRAWKKQYVNIALTVVVACGACDGAHRPDDAGAPDAAGPTDAASSPDQNDARPSVTPSCGGKQIYVDKGPDGGRYIDGKTFTYQPGDVFVLRASGNPYSYFSINDVHGTADCPILIVNEGAQVEMTAGIALTNCTYIGIRGTGSGDVYGFHIAEPATRNGPGISVSERSAHIEVAYVQIEQKLYGFWIKQEASCDPALQYPNWVIDDFELHHNEIKDVGQEGMYLGSTAPNGGRFITCDGQMVDPWPLRLGNFRIHHNRIEHTNRSGIQLSDAETGDNQIYENDVTGAGYELDTAQGNGIVLGGYTHAHVHDNRIADTFTMGIFSLGAGEILIERNTISGSGHLAGQAPPGMASIMIDTRPTTPLTNVHFVVRDNQVGENTDVNVHVYKTVDAYAPANRVCRSGGSIAVAAGIDWSADCP